MDIPVLLLIFNRLEPVKQVLEAIRQVKPSKLYIAGDGFRKNRHGEAEKVQTVRNYVLNGIDWECDTKTLFREENIGCKYAVFGALKWFFSHEEMGIILEDDCLPNESFFLFCEELLGKYKYTDRVAMVSGRNDLELYHANSSGQYFFSTRGFVWGWATWRRVIDTFDVELGSHKHPINVRYLAKHSSSWVEFFYRLDTVRKIKKQEVNSWAYPWNLNLLMSDKVAIVPHKNLIKNIGFSSEATHTTGNREDDISQFDLTFPCYSDQDIFPDTEFTKRVILSQFSGTLKFIFYCIPPFRWLKEFLKKVSKVKATG